MEIINLDLLNDVISPKPLTRSQWIEFYKHLQDVERSEGSDSELYKLLDALRVNQTKIEVFNRYSFVKGY